MSYTITVPQRELRLEIKSIEELPPMAGNLGVITIRVGAVDTDGQWVDSYDTQTVQIDGARYDVLVADSPPDWAPDKPAGTYRNADLWHYITELLGLN
jgi:hypothetical protein